MSLTVPVAVIGGQIYPAKDLGYDCEIQTEEVFGDTFVRKSVTIPTGKRITGFVESYRPYKMVELGRPDMVDIYLFTPEHDRIHLKNAIISSSRRRVGSTQEIEFVAKEIETDV